MSTWSNWGEWDVLCGSFHCVHLMMVFTHSPLYACNSLSVLFLESALCLSTLAWWLKPYRWLKFLGLHYRFIRLIGNLICDVTYRSTDGITNRQPFFNASRWMTIHLIVVNCYWDISWRKSYGLSGLWQRWIDDCVTIEWFPCQSDLTYNLAPVSLYITRFRRKEKGLRRIKLLAFNIYSTACKIELTCLFQNYLQDTPVHTCKKHPTE